MSIPNNAVIIVGGGLAGLSAAHQCLQRGANVVVIDKQGFLSGNSGKATSGINGAGTSTQLDTYKIGDSAKQFYDDSLATAKDRANPPLLKVLTSRSADAVHWLQQDFDLDLTVVSRLGGHSQPRTHRGHDSKFPGMAITYRLIEALEDVVKHHPERAAILTHCQVIDLQLGDDDTSVIGVTYKDLKSKEKHSVQGPVILATGGYAADFTKNSLLRKYRPDIIDLPSTNGVHATGDGQKIVMKNHGVGVDMDKVQVHPTGLIDLDDKDTIIGKSQPRFLFLGAEALRGEGGIMLNGEGHRFVDELGTRDHVSGEMEKEFKAGRGPLRLVLTEDMESKLEFHVKHYKQRNLMKTITGAELAQEIGVDPSVLASEFDKYNKAAAGDIKDPFGKRFFPNTPLKWDANARYHVSYVTRVLHFTMGGVKINDKSQVVHESGTPFAGLYAAGEVAGGVHGHNRLGGSSLLACVVFGRLAADEACAYTMQKLTNTSAAALRLDMIKVHLDPNGRGVSIHVGEDDATGTPATPVPASKTASSGPSPAAKSSDSDKFAIPDKQFTEQEVAQHNTKEDCWVIIKNVVLNLTPFLNDHPGGSQSIVTYAGRDATESFEMLHSDDFIPKYVPSCVLGTIKGKTSGLKI
ncbi:hypothetical protein DIURU_004450 [Diutina rugosa]|uniref:Cytochrome b5 heme-binding domain-containing protein n=1 Tax=Diutina rugosa TaxID=5481 RepID=A0A642UJL3_DIURU|nr:uncharacterized protein DIURU_004450 [Diutina rugosa]KAA8899069.1 hypothetical protein DIURU_004450 [Diutina rugosa]